MSSVGNQTLFHARRRGVRTGMAWDRPDHPGLEARNDVPKPLRQRGSDGPTDCQNELMRP